MQEILRPILEGSLAVTDPTLWVLVTLGFAIGVIVGALPGVGLTLSYGLALPFTFLMDPVYAVAFLLAMSVGGQYGNSIPAILMGLPGSAATVMTVADGYSLHRRGHTGLALAVQLSAAVVGQFVSVFFFVALVVPLSGLAYYFLAPELFALYMLGMMAIISLTGKHPIKGLVATGIGLCVGLVGLDPLSATPRFDFGLPELRLGLDTAPVLIGLLAVSELFRQTRQAFQWKDLPTQFDARFPKFRELRRLLPQMLGGTVIGTLVGAIPGAGTVPATLISYQQAQIWSKDRAKFGKGSTEGIAANEAAQNASNAGELIPTLGFGIPASGSTALLLGALTLQGFVPGPRLIENNPEMVSAAVAGMFMGTILIVLTGWWMCKALLRAVQINRSAVIVVSLAIVVVGVFSLQYRVVDVLVCLAFGALGYVMLRYGYSTAAAALAAILAADFERTFRIGLNITNNSIVEFVTRPVTALILVLAIAIGVWGVANRRKLARLERDNELAAEAAVAGAGPDGGTDAAAAPGTGSAPGQAPGAGGRAGDAERRETETTPKGAGS